MQEQFLPQMDPEPEMGAAAAAVCDTSPPPLHQNPPILAESAQPGTFDIARLFAVMDANLKENARQMKEEMKEKMDGNAQRVEGMNAKMYGMAQTMREEMRCMGAGLQDGLDKVKGGLEQF